MGKDFVKMEKRIQIIWLVGVFLIAVSLLNFGSAYSESTVWVNFTVNVTDNSGLENYTAPDDDEEYGRHTNDFNDSIPNFFVSGDSIVDQDFVIEQKEEIYLNELSSQESKSFSDFGLFLMFIIPSIFILILLIGVVYAKQKIVVN